MLKNWKKILIVILVVFILINLVLKIRKVSPFINQAKTVMEYDTKLKKGEALNDVGNKKVETKEKGKDNKNNKIEKNKGKIQSDVIKQKHEEKAEQVYKNQKLELEQQNNKDNNNPVDITLNTEANSLKFD